MPNLLQCFEAPSSSTGEFEGLETIARRKRITLPNSRFKSMWDTCILLLVLYNSISIPLEFGFGAPPPLGLIVWDILVDIMFILDILLQFNTAFYAKDGNLQISRHIIARNYLKFWFWIDLVASIPIDWFIRTGETSALGAVKMPRLLRLGRLLKKFDQFTAARAIRVVHILMAVIMLAHWVACLWWKIGYDGAPNGWPYKPAAALVILNDQDDFDAVAILEMSPAELKDVYFEQVDLGKRYITSLYWALTMVVKSPWLPPGTTAEQIFASFTIILGTLGFVTFIGTFTALIAATDRNNALYRDQITSLVQYAEARNLSSTSRAKLLQYWNQYFGLTGGMDERSILGKIPIHVRPQLLTDMHAQLIRDCAFLSECSSMGCAEFIYQLTPEVCLKGDQLLVAGTTPNLMYILTSGELQVSFPPTTAELKVKNVLGEEGHGAYMASSQSMSKRVPHGRVERPGSLIGFQAPFGPPKPILCSVRAYSRSTFFAVTRVALAEVLRNHPNDAPIFMKAMEHAARLLNPDKRRSQADGDDEKRNSTMRTSCVKPSGPRTGGTSISHNLALPDMQDKLQRVAVLQEAVSTGWLPPGYEEEEEDGKAAPGMTTAWMQEREEAERDIFGKLEALGDQMSGIDALLKKAVKEDRI